MENKVRTAYYRLCFSKESAGENKQHPIFQQKYLDEGDIVDGVYHSMEQGVFSLEIRHKNIISKISFLKQENQYTPIGLYRIFLENKKCLEINVEYKPLAIDEEMIVNTFIKLFDFVYFINNYGDFSKVDTIELINQLERVPCSQFSIEIVEEEQLTYSVIRD